LTNLEFVNFESSLVKHKEVIESNPDNIKSL